ncbi:hypothetical protein QR680_003723 [Steinernema hermaphroditum]|uniref:Uncharacterized protein n=1 Tax=Steinernema hermaphroditum TaxID=289476 RepID=A0AA39HNL7_9BILA|nr:hypothetical protein QR680_003723 [Steinernema hermaphroditum]
MNTFIVLFVLLFICDITHAGTSCCAGNTGCAASCSYQGCSGGYCDGWCGTCRCSGCGRGWRMRRSDRHVEYAALPDDE